MIKNPRHGKRPFSSRSWSPPPNRINRGVGKPRTEAQDQPTEKNNGVDLATAVPGVEFLMHDIAAPELAMVPISDIEFGDQILPVDGSVVEALKEVFAIDRQVLPVPIRKHQDGRYELISGYADIIALRELGRIDALALVVSGISDLDAQFLRIAHQIHPKLSVLDKALLHTRLETVMKERAASQHETALQTNRNLSVRKIAEHLGFKKDVVLRSRKMARIHPDVHRDIRESKFENNQKALLDISEAGATAAEQRAKLQELIERRSIAKQNRTNQKKNIVAPFDAAMASAQMPRDERANEMPDVPEFLRRNRAKATYDQASGEWSRCWAIVLALEPEDRQRFFEECLLPIVHLGPSADAPGTAEALPLSEGSDQ